MVITAAVVFHVRQVGNSSRIEKILPDIRRSDYKTSAAQIRSIVYTSNGMYTAGMAFT